MNHNMTLIKSLSKSEGNDLLNKVTSSVKRLEGTSLAPSSVPVSGVIISHQDYSHVTFKQQTCLYFVSI